MLLLTITITACSNPTSSSDEYSVEQLLDFYVEIAGKNKVELLPKIFHKSYIEGYGISKEKMTSIYEQSKEEFGDDFTVTYKVNSKEKISNEKLDQLNNSLSRFNIKASECYEVNVTITYSGSKCTDPDTYPLGYCKIDGAWYILE